MKEKALRIDRRRFLKQAACAALVSPLLQGKAGAVTISGIAAREARWYEKLPDNKVKCRLCPHECQVADRERGTCGVRENRAGVYYTLVYGNPCSAHIDPVEKKPLFHFHPGAQAFSIATAGCNFTCRFCQNWEISQKRPEQVKSIELPPERVVAAAIENNCQLIAHTYTEPVVFAEYMLECARLGRERGVPNVMISNGYIQKEPLRELCRQLGAIKIDLKAFSEKFYADICGGKLQPVLDTLLLLRGEAIWFEIVVLIVPSLNDSADEIGRMSRWIAKELGPDVPLHFSRYYPTFMIRNIPPTPPATLMQARQIALDSGLKFVYVGNLLSDAENTYCPSCGKLLIRRLMYSLSIEGMQGNRCKYCHTVIPGVFASR